jgi:hypothetical protein
MRIRIGWLGVICLTLPTGEERRKLGEWLACGAKEPTL